MPHNGGGPPQNSRLDSWKSIAAFFDRDERTVKRWERERALPVHRLPGTRGGVYAYTQELTDWMKHPASPDPAHLEPIDAPPETDSTPNPIPPDTSALALVSEVPQGAPPPRKNTLLWVAAATLAVTVLGLTTVLATRYRQPGVFARTAGAPAPDPVVRDLYLKGRYHWEKRTPEDLNKAVEYFNQAIAKDPKYAPAYVGLADTYNLMREYTSMPDNEAYPRALAAARKAIELDSSSAEAHKSLAFATFYWEWDAAAAEREFRRAIELDPNCAVAHHWYATFLITDGRPQESVREIERARQLDPASTSIVADMAWIQYGAGNKQQGEVALKQVEESAPEATSPHRYLSMIYLEQGDYPRYLAEERKETLLTRDANQLAVLRAAEAGYAAGGGEKMLQNILRVQESLYRQSRLSVYEMAATLSLLGRKQEALASLQAAYRNHDPRLIALRGDFRFESLHDDPSFRELVLRVGLPPVA